MAWGMRVIECYGLPEVAVCFVHRLTKDPAPASILAHELSRSAAYVCAGVLCHRLAMRSTHVVLTCIGPRSAVPLLFGLTIPGRPAST